ncbi:MAG: hypothetical protein K2L11_05945, partial [Muribaculaceae bacterium]|nr:hypothetical protein [Muribaculaceae bacterium]
MKIRNNTVLISALGLVVLLGSSGCSIFKPSSNQEGSGKGLQGWIETEKTDAAKDEKEIKTRTEKGEKAAKAEAE